MTDWRAVVARPDIDLVDISSPGNTHRDIAVAAAQNGKHIICEKPLANTLEGAKAMWYAVEEADVINMVNYNYRRTPAIALAKKMIESGAIGEIRQWRSRYLQDWIVDPAFPLVWRLKGAIAGSGALGDIGAHSIDLARFLVGEISEVTALTKTFIKERPLPSDMTGLSATAGEARGPVTVDDAAIWLAKFEGDVIGTFEATRMATGRRNHNAFEISGSKGSIAFDFERMNELEYFSSEDPEGRQGWRTIQATDPGTPYVDAWWPAGHGLGYEHTFVHAIADLLEGIGQVEMVEPDFADGTQTQAVLEAVLSSAKSGEWTAVSIV
jgi:predicted dehydrogenase